MVTAAISSWAPQAMHRLEPLELKAKRGIYLLKLSLDESESDRPSFLVHVLDIMFTVHPMYYRTMMYRMCIWNTARTLLKHSMVRLWEKAELSLIRHRSMRISYSARFSPVHYMMGRSRWHITQVCKLIDASTRLADEIYDNMCICIFIYFMGDLSLVIALETPCETVLARILKYYFFQVYVIWG